MNNKELIQKIGDAFRALTSKRSADIDLKKFAEEFGPVAHDMITQKVVVPDDFLAQFTPRVRELIVLSALAAISSNVNTVQAKIKEASQDCDLVENGSQSGAPSGYFNLADGQVYTKEQMEEKGFKIDEKGNIVDGPKGADINVKPPKICKPEQPGLKPQGKANLDFLKKQNRFAN